MPHADGEYLLSPLSAPIRGIESAERAVPVLPRIAWRPHWNLRKSPGISQLLFFSPSSGAEPTLRHPPVAD